MPTSTTADPSLPRLDWPAEVMSPQQVADTVALTAKTVRRHIRHGRLRAVRFGATGGYRIHRDDAQRWVAEHVVGALAPVLSVDQRVARARGPLARAPKAAVPPWHSSGRAR
jgi:excisionase family DNA binding protein